MRRLPPAPSLPGPSHRAPQAVLSAVDKGCGEEGDRAPPASALGTLRCAQTETQSNGLSVEQERQKQRAAWYAIPRSVALDPYQILRAPGRGKAMAVHYTGSYGCAVCEQKRWGDVTGFSPLFFMRCGNLTCGEIVCGM